MSLNDISLNFTDCKKIERSSILIVSVEKFVSCDFSYTETQEWKMYLINENGVLIREMDILSNPSIYSNEISFQSNTVEYGVYKFSYSTKLYALIGSTMSVFESSISTFLKVVPSGLVVYVFQNGASQITIGYNQSIELRPKNLSYDLDNLISPSNLEFEFYCGLPGSFQIDISNYSIDLSNISLNHHFINGTCFNSTG